MPTQLLIAAACVALAACSGMNASGGATASLATQDRQFMEDIVQANLAEIATGKLATAKGQSQTVRQFGQRMIDDHTTLLSEGAKLAKAKGMAVPKEPNAKHQAAMKQLESLSGASFDRAYMSQMVKDHEETLDLLKRASTRASDGQIRDLAKNAIPVVEHHRSLAEQITGG